MDFADTSFLLSFAGNDVNTRAAVAHVNTGAQAVAITDLSRLEVENALSLLVFRKEIDSAEAAKTLASFELDEEVGNLVHVECDWEMVLERALRLSRDRTARGGHRLADLLHVAAALEAGATAFLTFDKRQRELAKAEGLAVGP